MDALRSFFPARYRLVLVAAGLSVAIATLTRLVLGLALVRGPGVGFADFAAAFAVGLIFDLVAALGLAAPLAVYLAVVPERWFRGRFQRRLLLGGLFLFTFGLLFVAAAEYFFFDEFASRFNFVAVDYLLYPTEVGENIWESYPTGWILTTIALVALAALSLLRRQLDPADEASRLRRLLAEPTLASLPSEPLAPRRIRPAEGPSESRRPPNVVVVLEESFGAEFVGALHKREVSLTPEFDALAAQGTLLTRAYSTGNRTIRAIEATITGLPPLPGASLVRRDQSRDLFTLPTVLRDRGYETLFLYGGRALFDGMGSFLGANGVDRIVDQGDFPAEAFRTAWGVADEDLFDRAIVEMDQLHSRDQPFFSLVLTVSNHRPYRFPTERCPPLAGLRRRENAVHYADHALGRFLREAREHPFYADTLFILMGDHGARVYGAAEVPLASYEVPILFLGPGIEPGRRVDTLASSLDVPPTVLGILGLEYESKFFGQDVLRAAPDRGRAFFVHNHHIGMLRGADIAVLGLRGSTQAYRIAGEDLAPLDPSDPIGQELIRDTIAVFESVDRVYRAGGYRFESRGRDLVIAVK